MNWKKGFKRVLFCLSILLALFAALCTIGEIKWQYDLAQKPFSSRNFDVLFKLDCFVDENGIPFIPDKLTTKEISTAKKELTKRSEEIASLPDIDMFDVASAINTLEELENNFFAKLSYRGMIGICVLGGVLAASGGFVGTWLIVGFAYFVISWILHGFTDFTKQKPKVERQVRND